MTAKFQKTRFVFKFHSIRFQNSPLGSFSKLTFRPLGSFSKSSYRFIKPSKSIGASADIKLNTNHTPITHYRATMKSMQERVSRSTGCADWMLMDSRKEESFGRRRRERIGEWLTKIGHGLAVESATGLLRDLVLLVGEFVVALEHRWSPLPRQLLKRPECNCMKLPGDTIKRCDCSNWLVQHYCSLYTIQEAKSNEFTINIGANATYNTNWWTGIIWSSKSNCLQHAAKLTKDLTDSMRTVPDVFACMVSDGGFVRTFDITGSSGVIYMFDRFSINNPIIVRIIDDTDGQKVRFGNNGVDSIAIDVPTRLQHYYARPFVQLDAVGSHNHCALTIATPLF